MRSKERERERKTQCTVIKSPSEVILIHQIVIVHIPKKVRKGRGIRARVEEWNKNVHVDNEKGAFMNAYLKGIV